MGKKYAEMTPEEKEAHKKRVISSNAKNNKRIPLDLKKEVAEIIYSHAEQRGIGPITWIKEAIAEKYQRETGHNLEAGNIKQKQ